jgi:hypothetical protein
MEEWNMAEYCQAAKYGMYAKGATCGELAVGTYSDVPFCGPHLERSKMESALRRSHSVLATIINAGLTFDGGVGGKFMGEIRNAELEAREVLGSTNSGEGKS